MLEWICSRNRRDGCCWWCIAALALSMLLSPWTLFGFTARLKLIRLITMKLAAKCAAIKPRTCQGHHTINKIKLNWTSAPNHPQRKRWRARVKEKWPNGVTISWAWNKFLFIKHVRASCRYFWIPDLKPKLMNCGGGGGCRKRLKAFRKQKSSEMKSQKLCACFPLLIICNECRLTLTRRSPKAATLGWPLHGYFAPSHTQTDTHIHRHT